MATSSALAPREMTFTTSGDATSIAKPFFVARTLFGQLVNAMMVARTRAAEREIERRFLSNQTHW